jgi:hypothetical protein
MTERRSSRPRRNEPPPDTLTKKLLTFTAIIEAATGLGLLAAMKPSAITTAAIFSADRPSAVP